MINRYAIYINAWLPGCLTGAYLEWAGGGGGGGGGAETESKHSIALWSQGLCPTEGACQRGETESKHSIARCHVMTPPRGQQNCAPPLALPPMQNYKYAHAAWQPGCAKGKAKAKGKANAWLNQVY